MLKLTKTGIGLLTKQYRSVLMKCVLLNLGLFFISFPANAIFNIYYNSDDTSWNNPSAYDALYTYYHSDKANWHTDQVVYVYTTNDFSISNYYTKTETDSAISQAISGFVTNDVQSLNYYYTFRVDERDEVIEFAKELINNKKEMSSLDFMPIKSSSDLRINLIKAEDLLTFSAKTRDDSLDLREVCHA